MEIPSNLARSSLAADFFSSNAPGTHHAHSSMLRWTSCGISPLSTKSDTARLLPTPTRGTLMPTLDLCPVTVLIAKFAIMRSTDLFATDVLEIALQKFHIFHPTLRLIGPRQLQHFVGHAQAVDLADRPT